MRKINAVAFIVVIINFLAPAYTRAASVEQAHASLRGTWTVDIAETGKALQTPNNLTPGQKDIVVSNLRIIGLMDMAFTDAGLEIDNSFGKSKPVLYQLDKAASSPQNLIYRSTVAAAALAVTSNKGTLLTITEHSDRQGLLIGFASARWSRSTSSSKSPEQRLADYKSGYLVWLRNTAETFKIPPPPPNLAFNAKALYNEFINESPKAFDVKQRNKIVVAVRPVTNSNDTPQTDIGFRYKEGYGEHIFGLRVLGVFDNNLVGNDDLVLVGLESGYRYPNRQQTAPQIYSANKKCEALSGLSSCPGLVCFPSRKECSMITLKVENYGEIEKYANEMQK